MFMLMSRHLQTEGWMKIWILVVGCLLCLDALGWAQQHTEGDCSPVLRDVGGSVYVNIACPGLPDKAVKRMNELLGLIGKEMRSIKKLLANKIEEANRFAQNYHALKARVIKIGETRTLYQPAFDYLENGRLEKAMAVLDQSQEFDLFSAWVEEFRIGPEQITVVLTYLNKTKKDLYFALDTPKGNRTMTFMGAIPPQMKTIEGPGKTYVLDPKGNRYNFLQASGLSGGYYGWYSFLGSSGYLWDEGTSFLNVPPMSQRSAVLIFETKRDTEKDATYDFLSGQLMVKQQENKYG